jgi:hypothetical protein
VEKEARSIHNDPTINQDRMIIPRGADHGIGAFQTTTTKARSLSNGACFSIRLRFIFQLLQNSVCVSLVCKPVIPGFVT